MRLAVVSGDGLPVSGLLTVLRNALDVGREVGEIELPVAVDFGYAWRPDKEGFFPDGAGADCPDWLRAVPNRVPEFVPRRDLARALFEIRGFVANEGTTTSVYSERLRARCIELSHMYARHFSSWFSEHDVDWIIALNMTLSDAVPATLGLHQAAHERFGTGRPGGVVYWDHDLFKSCSIHADGAAGARVYPRKPTAMCPIPQKLGYVRWIVVSERLREEAAGYPTDLDAIVVPNPLPAVTDDELTRIHHLFAAAHRLDLRRPILLVPARVFRIKGIEIAVDFLSCLRRVTHRRSEPMPYLLIFGALGEDPIYAAEMKRRVDELKLVDSVRFLDGVPLTTHERDTEPRLDERDLLRLARATRGAVIFSPAVEDVETIGLGPALAATAGIPFAISDYAAFRDVYGPGFSYTQIPPSATERLAAASRFCDDLRRFRDDDPQLQRDLLRNCDLVKRVFPCEPWRDQWRQLFDVTSRRSVHVKGTGDWRTGRALLTAGSRLGESQA